MRRPIAFRRIADVAAVNIATIVERWLPGGKRRSGEWVVRNPRRLDRHAGSFSVNLRTGAWGDFATRRPRRRPDFSCGLPVRSEPG